MKFRQVVALLLLVMVGVVTGCGATGGTQNTAGQGTAPAKPAKLVIAYQTIPNGEVIVKQQGWLEKSLGIPIEWKPFAAGRDVNQAVAAGSVDLGLVGTSLFALGIPQGLQYQNIFIFDIEGDNESLVVRTDRNIETVKDLVGKTVATPFGSTTHYSLLAALKDNGVDPGQVHLLDMQPQDILAAWTRGDLDAAYVWEPTLAKLLADHGKRLVSSAEMAKKGYVTGDVTIVSNAFAQKYPDIVVKYLEAEVRAIDFIKQQPDQAAALIAKDFGISQDDAAAQLKELVFLTGEEQASADWLGGKMAQYYHDTGQFLVSQKIINTAPSADDYAKAINTTFLKQALHNLGKGE